MSDVLNSTDFEERLAHAEKTLQEDARAGFSAAQNLTDAAAASNDPAALNKAKELLARSYQANGNYHKALQTCLEALPYFESTEDYAWAAKCLNTLGGAYNFLGEHENRLHTNLTCLAYRRKGGDEAGEIATLSNIGDTYNALGNHDKALEYFNLCLEFSSISERTRTLVVHNLGETEFFKGNFEKAQEYFALAVDLARKTAYYVIEEVAFLFLGKIHFRNNNFHLATECLDAAEQIAREKKYTGDLPVILELQAQIAEAQGRLADALKLYKEHIQLSTTIRQQNDVQAMQDMQFAYRVEKLQEENRVHKEKNREIRQAYLKIAQQHRMIEEKNRSITDSINYALKIQRALLPSDWRLHRAFPDCFVFNCPRDIVSGDFYWLHETETIITLAVADCTGHGVPGALMSIVGIDCLNIVITDPRATDAGKILELLDAKVISALNMEEKFDGAADGMDITVIQKNKITGEVIMASANRPVFLGNARGIQVIRADKFPIGAYFGNEKTFRTQQLHPKPGDMLYLFTDGITDQFGGPRGKKLKLKGFQETVQTFAAETPNKQLIAMELFFQKWQGRLEQLDDVLVIGIKL